MHDQNLGIAMIFLSGAMAMLAAVSYPLFYMKMQDSGVRIWKSDLANKLSFPCAFMLGTLGSLTTGLNLLGR